MLLNEFLKEHRKVEEKLQSQNRKRTSTVKEEFEATNAQQQKEIDRRSLRRHAENQAAQIEMSHKLRTKRRAQQISEQ